MPANDNDIALTDAESAEIAAECINALEWQLTYTANPNKDDIPTDEMIGAVSPKRPAPREKLCEAAFVGTGWLLWIVIAVCVVILVLAYMFVWSCREMVRRLLRDRVG